jgi:antitoxin PrlF
MAAATITSKGQITLPKLVRVALGLDAGDRVDFIAAPDGGYTLVPVKSSIQSLKGCIAAPLKPVSIDDMNQAIRRRVVAKAAKALGAKL